MSDLDLLHSIQPTLAQLMELVADDPEAKSRLQRKIRRRILPRLKRIAHLYADLQEVRARAQRPRRRGRSAPRSAKHR